MSRPKLLDLFCGAGGCAVGSDTERAWAAGFFDGEGYVGASRDKRPGRRPCLQLSIEQVDPRPLERFKVAVGWNGEVGKRQARRAPGRQIVHRIHMGHAATVRTFNAMWPWLSEPKQEQFLRAIKDIGYEEAIAS